MYVALVFQNVILSYYIWGEQIYFFPLLLTQQIAQLVHCCYRSLPGAACLLDTKLQGMANYDMPFLASTST